MWKVTRTNKAVFGDEKFNTEYRNVKQRINETDEEFLARFERLKSKCNKKFRVCDDDGTIYFWGVATTDDDDRAFQPLDNLGADYGCTYIEYKNCDGEWEML